MGVGNCLLIRHNIPEPYNFLIYFFLQLFRMTIIEYSVPQPKVNQDH